MKLLSINKIMSGLSDVDLADFSDNVYTGNSNSSQNYDTDKEYLSFEFANPDDPFRVNGRNRKYFELTPSGVLSSTNAEPFPEMTDHERETQSMYHRDTEWIRDNASTLDWETKYQLPEFDTSLQHFSSSASASLTFFQWIINEEHFTEPEFYAYLDSVAFESDNPTDVFIIPYTGDSKQSRKVKDLHLISNYQGILKEKIFDDIENFNIYNHQQQYWNLQYMLLVIDQYTTSELVSILHTLSTRRYDFLREIVSNQYRQNDDDRQDYINNSLYAKIVDRMVITIKATLEEIAQTEPIVLPIELARNLYQIAPNLQGKNVQLRTIIPMRNVTQIGDES